MDRANHGRGRDSRWWKLWRGREEEITYKDEVDGNNRRMVDATDRSEVDGNNRQGLREGDGENNKGEGGVMVETMGGEAKGGGRLKWLIVGSGW